MLYLMENTPRLFCPLIIRYS